MAMKVLIVVLNLILITAATYFSVDAAYKIAARQLAPGLLSPEAPASSSATENDIHRPISHYDAITQRNLFQIGNKTVVEKPKPVDVEALKETSLKLKLWGTVTGDKGRAYAVIEDLKTRRQNLYRIGDSIQDAIIKIILRERVVLQVAGKNEVLQMEKMEAGGTARHSTGTAVSAPPQGITVARAQIDNAIKDADHLMKQIRVRPHFTDGQPDGLSLTGIKPNSLFRKMGLRNGDIIQGVDDQEVRSVEDALKLYEGLKSSSNLALQIKRRGREKTINYSIEP
jgi:general secretion pathway protein C